MTQAYSEDRELRRIEKCTELKRISSGSHGL